MIDPTLITKTLENHISNNQLTEAIRVINEIPDILHTTDSHLISIISLILILTEDFEECIIFSEHKLKNNPSADLYYNLGYAYGATGQTLLAIKNYQCARLFTINPSLREDANHNIIRLRNPEADEEVLKQYFQYLNEKKEYIKAQLSEPHKNILPSDYIKTANPFCTDKPRIFYGTMEIANHISHYIKYFRENGYDVFGVNYSPTYLNYDCDFSYSLNDLSPNHVLDHYLLNAIDLIADYDVFHFVFNTTLMPNCIDVIPLKKLNKKVFMHNLGSEIRIPEIARKHHPYWKYAEDYYLSNLNSDQIKYNMSFLSKWIDHCIVNDYEMYSYVKEYYKNIHFVGLPISLKDYPYIGLNNDAKKLKIVHAPTNPAVKGSRFFEEALRQLQNKFNFEYILIQGKSHEDAKKLYRQADIVLDELIIGTYGSLTVECMAMGKCIVTFLHPGFKPPHGEDVPVCIASIDTLIAQIEHLLSDKDYRTNLSNYARKYVERFNDITVIGQALLKIYQC